MAADKVTDLALGMARDVIPITPADADIAPFFPRALFIATGGSLSVLTERGNTRVLTVPDNFLLYCKVRRVNAATTATGIIGYE